MQLSHLVRFGTAGFGQSLQSPRRLASSRLAWATRRCSSFRSGVWSLFLSYSRRACFLASTSSGVGSGRRSAFGAFGVAFVLGFLTFGFLGGFCTGGFLAFLGPPPAFCGFGNGNVYSKVRPTARGSGETVWLTGAWPGPKGLSPRGRGNPALLAVDLGLDGSIPAWAGKPLPSG